MTVKRRFCPKKDIVRQLRDALVQKFGSGANELFKGAIEVAELESGREVLLIGGAPIAFRAPDGIFPTLFSVNKFQLKRVIVDMGAVPHVAGGADVMAPGVVSAEEGIAPGDCVVVVDERHGKPLAIGTALVGGSTMKGPKGKVIKNLHYVGDEIWKPFT